MSIVVVLRVESAAAVEEMSTRVIAKSFVMLGARCPRSAGLTVRESIAPSWGSGANKERQRAKDDPAPLLRNTHHTTTALGLTCQMGLPLGSRGGF